MHYFTCFWFRTRNVEPQSLKDFREEKLAKEFLLNLISSSRKTTPTVLWQVLMILHRELTFSSGA